jgi:site-specific DNA recombinase
MAKEKLTAFGYVRVSTSRQIDKGGPDRQRAAIEKYAKAAKIEIVRFYEDAVSGTTSEDERPQFNEMVVDLLSDGVSLVVVESLDRLARTMGAQESLLIYLASREKPIDLISANTGENITKAILEDPMKEAIITMQAVFARLERKTILLRLKKGREKRRNDTGKCGGPTQYGDCDNDCNAEKHSDRCEKERGILDEIARLRMRPRPLSFGRIAFVLNEMGTKTRMGRDWSYMTVYNAVGGSHDTKK